MPNRTTLRYLIGATIALAMISVSIISCTYSPNLEAFDLPSDLSLYESRDAVVIAGNDQAVNPVGFMFYPGALVDPHSYIPAFAGLASSGIPVMIVRETGNLAIFDPGVGLSLKDDFPGVTDWVIGGHSLGGAMAAWTVYDHDSAFKGVVLLASYPAESKSLAQKPVKLLSISAEFDGLATRAKIAQFESLLPTPATRLESVDSIWPSSSDAYSVMYEIPGGNHAGFASYGAQAGDGEATISTADQHSAVEYLILNFFENNGWKQP